MGYKIVGKQTYDDDKFTYRRVDQTTKTLKQADSSHKEKLVRYPSLNKTEVTKG